MTLARFEAGAFLVQFFPATVEILLQFGTGQLQFLQLQDLSFPLFFNLDPRLAAAAARAWADGDVLDDDVVGRHIESAADQGDARCRRGSSRDGEERFVLPELSSERYLRSSTLLDVREGCLDSDCDLL